MHWMVRGFQRAIIVFLCRMSDVSVMVSTFSMSVLDAEVVVELAVIARKDRSTITRTVDIRKALRFQASMLLTLSYNVLTIFSFHWYVS